MAIIQPAQLATGSYSLSGSFSGSFQGSGAGLNNIPSSAIVGLSSTQIASGAVTASVSTGTGSFTVTSGSSTFMFVSSSGRVGIGTTTPLTPLDITNTSAQMISLNRISGTSANLFITNIRTGGGQGLVLDTGTGGFSFRIGSTSYLVSENNRLGVNTNNDTLISQLQVKGSGTTSDTTALLVQNSNSETTIIAKNDRTIGLGRSAFTNEGYGGIAIGYPNAGNLLYSSYDAHTFVVYSNTGYETALLIKGNGAASRILIGAATDTGHKLTVSGSGASGSVNLDNTLYISGSNVGIGTTTPQGALHIAVSSSTPALVLSDVGAPNTIPTLQFRRGPLSAYSLQIDWPGNLKARFQIGDAVTGYEFTGGPISLTGGRSIEFGGITGQVATGIIGSIHTDNNNGQLTFSTRGSGTTAERMRIFNTGNVAINTTTDAGFKLDVNGTLRVSGAVTISSPTFNILTTTSSFLVDTSANNYRIANLFTYGGYNPGGFANNTIDIFSVGGNPSSSLNGSEFFRLNFNGGNSGGIYGSSGNNTVLAQLNATTTSNLYLTAQGSGLLLSGGTNNALVSTVADGQNLNLRSEKGTGSGGGGINYLSSINGSSHSHRFFHNNVEQMRLQFSGNLLINTTTDAGFKLDVNGTARVQDRFQIGTGTTFVSGFVFNPFGGQQLEFWNGVAMQIRFTREGNNSLSFGTNGSGYAGNLSTAGLMVGGANANSKIDSAMLQVESTTRGFLPPRLTTTQKNAIATPATGLQLFDTTTLTPSIYNGTNWQDVLVPNSAGNVGIGTSTPTQRLDVNGTPRFYGGTTTGAIFGSGTLINLASDAYMLATSAAGNAGYLCNRPNNSTFGSFDIVTGANTNTGWSMQLRPSTTYWSLTNRITDVPAITAFTTSNIGINTTTDAGFKLDVNGTARVSGNLYIGPSPNGTYMYSNGYDLTMTTRSSDRAIWLKQGNSNLVMMLMADGNAGANNNNALTVWTTANTSANTVASFCVNGISGNTLIGTSTDIASSILTVNSTTKGFLPPRMTTTQKNAIATPAEGLMVYDTVLKRPCFYDGTSWVTL